MAFSARQLEAWSEAGVTSARAVLPLVFEYGRPESVVDVGCLFGGWAAVATELGVHDVMGIDGDYVDRARLRIPERCFRGRDLSRRLRIGRGFDLAMSLEVAHYLPEERASGFVADLCALAPHVLFSSAIPHQGGHGHVNEQWPDYWAQHFAARGYTAVDCVRDEVWERDDVAPWYAQNTLLFVAPHARTAALVAHHGFGRSPARVHPSVFLPYASGRYQALRRRAAELVAR